MRIYQIVLGDDVNEKVIFQLLNFCSVSGNVAYGKRTREYGGYGQWPSTNAVDGGHDPVMTNGTCTHPGVSGDVPAWWEVDLGAMYVVSSINITNRGDCCQGGFLSWWLGVMAIVNDLTRFEVN